jgi:molybdate transport system regulatory protein
MTKAKSSDVVTACVLPRLRVTRGRGAVLGPGRVELLELIGETGSLRSAAAQMGMAYLTAWKHVKSLNGMFQSPVVVCKRGGKTGGGAVLTAAGRRAVTLYRQMEKRCELATRDGARAFHRLLRRRAIGLSIGATEDRRD